MVAAPLRKPVATGVVLFWLLTGGIAGAADSLETVQKAAAEWAKLRAETVQLQTDWQWQSGVLEASLTALKAKITTLERERNELKSSLQAEAAKSAELLAQNQAAQKALQKIDERLKAFAQRLVELRPWLPPRVAQGLELAYRSIADPNLGPAERMQHLVTILNRCGSFNKLITVGEEALALEGDGEPRLLEVVYWGLSHAYALDRSREIAYLGRPGTQGWTWEKIDGAAEAVAHVIAIHEEAADPEFVALPAQITDPFRTPPAGATAQK